MRAIIPTALGIITVAALVGCGSSGSTNATAPGGAHSTTITLSSTTAGGGYGGGGNYFFEPNPDTVAHGVAVTFTIGSVTHNVHFDTGPAILDSIPAANNTSAMRTFPTAGTYTFHCSIHNFSGTVVAQ